HLFKEYMNISPHQYIISERITRAKQLLLRQEMTISEIALACGFNSQSHLTCYFRQHIGLTPKAYQMSL
ncbi:MAG: helix-turn-helix transcriptional regulator, partial [Cyanobacteria bacterium P01_F01_bin.42]